METSLRTQYVALLILPILASCSTGGAKGQDRICTEIATFASTVETGHSRAVVLRGGWGGDAPNTLMTHDCLHAGYDPGKALCDYLVPNTSWEFGSYNASRVAQCLDSAERRAFIRRINKHEWPTEMTSSLRLLADKRIQVTVRLEKSGTVPGKLSDLSVLTLSVERGND